MLVTDIKQQQKNQARYSIYVDNKYSFSLSESGLLASGLAVGKQLSGSQLDDLKNKSEQDKLYNSCLNLIARRKRSQWEISQYLRRKSVEPEVVSLVEKRLAQNHWLDDLDFARSWVSDRRLLKSVSRRRLWQELTAKRVEDSIIKTVLVEDGTDEVQVLEQLVASKRKQTRYQDNQKLMAYLLRQGYNYDDVKLALSSNDQSKN